MLRICFVLDDRKVLVGVVSDGDIRRALLNGRKLDDQTHSVMNKDFVSFPIGIAKSFEKDLVSESGKYHWLMKMVSYAMWPTLEGILELLF